jgi:hypothetical protein
MFSAYELSIVQTEQVMQWYKQMTKWEEKQILHLIPIYIPHNARAGLAPGSKLSGNCP